MSLSLVMCLLFWLSMEQKSWAERNPGDSTTATVVSVELNRKLPGRDMETNTETVEEAEATFINLDGSFIPPPSETFCTSMSSCTQRSMLYDRNCYCDELCIIYGDCCQDVDTLANRSPVVSEYRFLKNKIKGTFQCMSLAGTSLRYVINKCPSSWNNSPQVRDFCENPYEYWPSNDLFLIIPAIGRNTGLLFDNVYCSMCHGEVDVTYYGVKFCHSQPGEIRGAPSPPWNREPDVITPIHTTQTTTERALNISEIVKNCTPVKTEPDLSSVKYSSKPCQKYISTCNDVQNNIYKQKCEDETFVSFVYTLPSRFDIYKNKFCAFCNGLNESEITCRRSSRVHAPPYTMSGMLSYSVLFDPNALSLRAHGKDIDTKKCSHGQIFDFEQGVCRQLLCASGENLVDNRCVSMRKHKQTIAYDYDDNRVNNSESLNSTRFRTPYSCPKLNYTVYVHFQNGSLYVNATGKLYVSESFEILNDGAVLVCANLSRNFSFSENADSLVFNFDEVQVICSAVGLVISSVCLGLHLIIYTLIPTLRNLPGKILMCLVSSWLVAQVMFLLNPVWAKHESACVIIAALMHYSYLAAFFWTSVMSFDICHTFSNSSGISNASKHTKRVVFYSVYAWGCALLVTLAGVVVDQSSVPEEFKPRYGGYGVCWITQKYGLLIFFIGPVSVLLFSDFIFFVLSVVGIRRASKAASFATKTSEKRRLIVYIKLSAVMGLTWIIAYVAMATNVYELWFVFIFLNTWLGVFIFLAFVCNKKVFKLLQNRVGMKKEETTKSRSNTFSTAVQRSISAPTPDEPQAESNTKEATDKCTPV